MQKNTSFRAIFIHDLIFCLYCGFDVTGYISVVTGDIADVMLVFMKSMTSDFLQDHTNEWLLVPTVRQGKLAVQTLNK